jgi:intracellular sulfur oxidation DsrE/DsrF family protein
MAPECINMSSTTTVKDASSSEKMTASNLQVISCFNKMNSGTLAAKVLIQNANIVPIGRALVIRLSMTGMTPVAFE